MKLTPLADRVVLKAMEAEETTKGGIILTSSAKEKALRGRGHLCWPRGMVDGKEIVMTVKPGDKVITDKYAGSNVKIGDEEFTIVRLNDILAIVD